MNLRALLAGVVAGIGLSVARAPEGLHLVGTPAVLAGDAMLFRGGMLIAIGIAWWLARWGDAPPRFAWVLWGAVLGFGAHGLWLAEQVRVVSYTSGAAAALAAVALTFVILRCRDESAAPERTAGRDNNARPNAGHLAGFAMLGAGIGLAFEAVARPLRLLGGGSENETVFGGMLLFSLAVGAGTFGPLLGARRATWWIPLAGTAAAALGMYGLSFLGQASDPDGYDVFINYFRWTLKLNSFWELDHGTFVHDIVVGLRTFVLSGFALGAALYALRHRLQVAALAIGAGLGLLAMPLLVEWTARGAQDRLAELPAFRVAIATSIAAAGAWIALAGERGSSHAARAAGALGVLAIAALLWVRENPRALPLSPWEIWRVRPAIVAEIREGIVTIELRRHLGETVTLNRRALTPGDVNFKSDHASITASVGTWGGTRPLDGKVLLVGQLTPDRASILQQLGATAIDRTGAWHTCMADIESVLFGGPVETPGAILAPRDAARRLNDYCLILSPATWPQQLGTTAAWRAPAPAGTRRVLWFRGDQPNRALDWGARILLAGYNFKHLLIGVVSEGERNDGWGAASELIPAGAGDTPPTPWERLCTREFERTTADLAGAGARLAAGARGSPSEALTEALAYLTAAQKRSTMWEEDAEATELDERGLAALRDATLAQLAQGALQPFLRSTVEYVASILVGKRRVEWIYEYIEPIGAASTGWEALERALAHADWEMLEYDTVAQRLEPLIEADPFNLEYVHWRGLALLHAGQPAAAADVFRDLVAKAPGQYALERELAIAMVRTGDPDGRTRVEALLLEHPEDDALERYLLPGPLPPLEPPLPFGTQGLGPSADH